MVIAAGSYPAGRWFESDRRYQKRPHGQAVKTSPFHGGNPSSSLGGVTKQREAALSERFFHKRITPHGGLAQLVRALALQARGHRFKSGSLHHLAARRISQHPAGKPCRVFALTPAARFPLASRTLPHKVSSLRFAPLRYFAGAPFERLQSGYFLYSVCCQRSRVRSVGEGSLIVFGARIALGSEKCVRSGAVSGTKSFDLIFALR